VKNPGKCGAGALACSLEKTVVALFHIFLLYAGSTGILPVQDGLEARPTVPSPFDREHRHLACVHKLDCALEAWDWRRGSGY
jgi:hypothetical protein